MTQPQIRETTTTPLCPTQCTKCSYKLRCLAKGWSPQKSIWDEKCIYDCKDGPIEWNANFNGMEIAKIIGQPVDPSKPYRSIMTGITETEQVETKDFTYSFDVIYDKNYGTNPRPVHKKTRQRLKGAKKG